MWECRELSVSRVGQRCDRDETREQSNYGLVKNSLRSEHDDWACSGARSVHCDIVPSKRNYARSCRCDLLHCRTTTTRNCTSSALGRQRERVMRRGQHRENEHRADGSQPRTRGRRANALRTMRSGRRTSCSADPSQRKSGLATTANAAPSGAWSPTIRVTRFPEPEGLRALVADERRTTGGEGRRRRWRPHPGPARVGVALGPTQRKTKSTSPTATRSPRRRIMSV
jgi:hypothetical protein